nr:transposase [Bifidobacterium sp. SO1]
MWRTAVTPVEFDHAQYRLAHKTTHNAALAWNWLVDHVRHLWKTEHRDPSQKEMRAMLKQAPASITIGLHAHVKQCMIDDLEDAIQTYRSNRANGDRHARAPYRHHNYRPLDFTKGYGWRLVDSGRTISLSRGLGQENLTVPVPTITDPQTGRLIPPAEWGTMRLCWDRNHRHWYLHVSVPTGKPANSRMERIMGVDEGIINPVTCAIETDQAYEILVVNGREARAAKHYANTRVARLQRILSRCENGSRRYRKIEAKLRKAYAIAQTRAYNVAHQTSRKTVDFMREHHANRIIAGDVRGIEQRTFQDESKRRRNKKTQRRRLSQWNRGQVENLIEHKSRLETEHVNESYSSQTCPACLTRNHPSGRQYRCHRCGFTCHRDAVGALNILQKATYGQYRPLDMIKPIMSHISEPRRSAGARLWVMPLNRAGGSR